jgi:hypothetical protein
MWELGEFDEPRELTKIEILIGCTVLGLAHILVTIITVGMLIAWIVTL